jgi:hypothetical protein
MDEHFIDQGSQSKDCMGPGGSPLVEFTNPLPSFSQIVFEVGNKFGPIRVGQNFSNTVHSRSTSVVMIIPPKQEER